MTLFVDKADAGARLDIYLADAVEEISRSAAQKLIEGGHVAVNGKTAKSNYKLKSADVVEAEIPEPAALLVAPENIPLEILYEDADVIVVNKPQGMVVHPAAGHYTGTLVNALLFHCGESLSGINGVLRPGIVHRIDKDTSGIVVAAKNDRAHQILSAQLAEHSMTRKYTALVCGNVKVDTGTIDKPLGRHKTDRKKIAPVANGKRAVTHYRVLKRYGKFTLVEASLETGRTHQIRVHMASIGHPLAGDTVYGGKDIPDAAGQVLHAGVLGFVHPNGEYMEFKAELPEWFEKVLQPLR